MMIDAKQTFIENWPPELMRLSFATRLFRLTPVERDNLSLLFEAYNGGQAQIDEATINSLRQQLTEEIAHFPHGAFVKLSSRSPKDAWDARDQKWKVFEGSAALQWFAESERIHDDLCAARTSNEPVYIAIREWRDICPQDEWRVFIKERRIVAVSQYDYYNSYPNMHGEIGSIRWAIDQFWPTLKAALHLDTVIADLWVRSNAHETGRVWEARLIEINPYGNWTDPCLLDWLKEPEWSSGTGEYEIVVR